MKQKYLKINKNASNEKRELKKLTLIQCIGLAKKSQNHKNANKL